ncbi:hypothetical protein NMY22_g14883 [Coprinellus aureogranulatus]|nr:hypothetical protein NMY22_g14883 [Coprinellus aureogranulatus]
MSYHYSPSQASWTDLDGKPYYPSTPSSTGSISTWGTAPSTHASAHMPMGSPYGSYAASPAPSVHSRSSQTSSTYVGSTTGSGYCASVASGSFAEIHPALRPGAAHALQFDIASSRFVVPGLNFDPNTAAFNPGLNRINLEFQGLSRRWVSKVSGGTFSSSSSGASVSTASSSTPPITIATILQAIYEHCRNFVTRDQDKEIPSNIRAKAVHYTQQRVAKSAHRGQASPNAMVLMDVLGPNTMFVGIVPKADDPKTWTREPRLADPALTRAIEPTNTDTHSLSPKYTLDGRRSSSQHPSTLRKKPKYNHQPPERAPVKPHHYSA